MFSRLNVHLSCTVALCARIVVFGASFGDALALFALGGAYAYSQYLKSKEETPINESIKQDLSDVRSTLAALKLGRAFGKN